MKELQRIKVGDFSITNAININEILENKNSKLLQLVNKEFVTNLISTHGENLKENLFKKTI